MSVGKTTLAKVLSEFSNYEYIDFDQLVYGDRVLSDKTEDIQEFSKTLDPDKNYVIDNWFKWDKGWYSNINKDTTLQSLDSFIPHDLTLALVGASSPTLVKRHNKRSWNGILNSFFYQNISHFQSLIYEAFLRFTKGI